MGLIRKSLAVGTIGVVNGSSKKQRVAAAQLTSLQNIERALVPPVAKIDYRLQRTLVRQACDAAKVHNANLAAHRANPTDASQAALSASWATYSARRAHAERHGAVFS